MAPESLRRASVVSHRYHSATLFLILMVFTVSLGSSPQASSQNVAIQLAELQGVKFVVPHGFPLEQSETNQVSFMRNSSEPLGLFVTVLKQSIDDKYLTDLSRNVVGMLRPDEDGFKWNVRETVEPRVSRYQTQRGTIKGLKGKTFVQIDYVVVRAQGKEVVIGSIGQFGEESTGPFLFEVAGREYSVRGWQALFQLISSVTGEKDNEPR